MLDSDGRLAFQGVFMSIGIVSQEEFEAELQRLSGTGRKESHPVVQAEIVDKPSRGRDEGDNNVPDSLRQIIGEEAIINGRQAALGLAGMFGISPSSVSAYAKGTTSTASYHEPKQSIISHINKSRRRAIKKASHVLNTSLEAITQDKLDYTDAKDLAGIARDMAAVIKQLEPQAEPESSNAPQFVVFAPQFRDERSYETINVKEPV